MNRLEYQKLLEDIDRELQMLGLCDNSHIGINQPGMAFASETGVSPMEPVFEERIRRETGGGPEHETLGIQTIMYARKIVLVAESAHKAEMVRQMLKGPVTEDVPASILQLHPSRTFLLDVDAAELVKDVV